MTTGDAYIETTLAIEAECPETWLARRLAAGKPAETWVPVPGWYYEQIGLPVPAVPHQVSDQGRIRKPPGKSCPSALMAGRRNCRPRSSTSAPTSAQAARRSRSSPTTSCWLATAPRTVRAGKPATSARATRTGRGTGTPRASPGATRGRTRSTSRQRFGLLQPSRPVPRRRKRAPRNPPPDVRVP